MTPYYSHAGIQIYHGDCREILPQLPKCDLVLTDPPYGLGRRLHDGGTWSTNPKYDAMLEWDVRLTDEEMRRIAASGKQAIVWGGNLYALPISRCWLTWQKLNSVPTMADFEMAWTSYDKPSRCFKYRIHPDGINQHPTQKPIALMRWCLTLTQEAQTVCDPFTGSGSTLVAAKESGKSAIGIEIEERYCEIAAKRLSQEVFNFQAAP